MRLPEVAARLRELAIEFGCDELSDLADEIARRLNLNPGRVSETLRGKRS